MLTMMILDENPYSQVRLANLCVASKKIGSLYICNSVENAMVGAKTGAIDFALLNIAEPGTAELELGDRVRTSNPNAVLMYIMTSDRLCTNVLRHGADYLIMNPYQDKDVAGAIERAVLLSYRQKNRLYVHTFGRFYVYYEGAVIYFKNKKARELMALCVDRRGGNVSMEEAIDVLWPEKPYDEKAKMLYRRAVISLRKTLNSYGLTEVFEADRGECHINPYEIRCDYYEYLDGMEQAKNSYHREYMFDYTWAEETNTRLLREIYGENDVEYEDAD